MTQHLKSQIQSKKYQADVIHAGFNRRLNYVNKSTSGPYLAGQYHNTKSTPSADDSQYTLMMTSTQVVETSVNVTSNMDDHIMNLHGMIPGFKPFTLVFKSEIVCESHFQSGG